MHCLVTAGPTYEPVDQVRRLTNFSTGRTGVELARALQQGGHAVTLLLGEQASWPEPPEARKIIRFTTGADLEAKIKGLRLADIAAVFHTAAVGDFTVQSVHERLASGQLRAVRAGKISSASAGLVLELAPAKKIIAHLREWFPEALLVGWKYEVDGDRTSALRKAADQVAANRLETTIANGPAYGEGYGWVRREQPPRHAPDRATLFAWFIELLDTRAKV